MDQLPLELWEAIGLSSDIQTVRALRKTCPIFCSLLTDESYEKKCKNSGVKMPPEYIQKVMESHPSLTLDYLTLYHNNPFGSNIGRLGSVSPSMLIPFSLSTHLDGKGRLNIDPLVTLAPSEDMKRGTLVYKLDLQEIGIPSWLMDIFRPRFSLTVHAYRMPHSDGDILVSAKLLTSQDEGSGAVCRKEHQGWFMAGWQASERPVEESVQMDFEVYGEGARVLSIVASCSGGGRLGEIEVKLHFGSEVSSDLEEQLSIWERSQEGTKKEEREESQIIQTSECRTILGVERNELTLRSSATLSLSRKSSASSSFSIDSLEVVEAEGVLVHLVPTGNGEVMAEETTEGDGEETTTEAEDGVEMEEIMADGEETTEATMEDGEEIMVGMGDGVEMAMEDGEEEEEEIMEDGEETTAEDGVVMEETMEVGEEMEVDITIIIITAIVRRVENMEEEEEEEEDRMDGDRMEDGREEINLNGVDSWVLSSGNLVVISS